jgi:hypothetical protein
MNIPLRHHYSPEFYLSRWCTDDGRLCQLTKMGDGRVIPNRRFPKQTGFEERLYEIEGLPPEQAQQVESGFMRSLDTLAAEALQALEADDPLMRRDTRLRSAWSRFILSLMLRDPQSIRALKDGYATQWASSMGDLEQRYMAQRGADDPRTFAAFLALSNRSTDALAMELAPSLIDHSGIGGLLNSMRWFVKRITSDADEFITSDRPVFSTWTFTEEDAFIFVPIGPKAVFVAVNDIGTQRRIDARDPAEFVTSLNMMVSGRAVKFAYARDDSLLPFIRQHMGTRQRPTLFEQLAERYRRAAPSELTGAAQ